MNIEIEIEGAKGQEKMTQSVLEQVSEKVAETAHEASRAASAVKDGIEDGVIAARREFGEIEHFAEDRRIEFPLRLLNVQSFGVG